MRLLIVTVLCLAAAGCGGGGSGPAAPRAPSSVQPNEVSGAAAGVRLVRIGTFSAPTYLTAPPRDPRTLFVTEQEGAIWMVRDGRVVPSPFLDLRRDVGAGGERGLLSMAFAPDYATSRRFYVYFTGRNGDIHIQEFRTRARDPERADRSTRRELLRIAHSRYTNHNGGQLQVGPDGLLYAGIGDGGSEGDPHRLGQKLTGPYAKILRFDPTASPVRTEVWAYGLRNPWRFSFDRLTGDAVIADVGQNAVEEVDFAPRGTGLRNYGWSIFEGRRRYNAGSAAGAVAPVIERLHSQGSCSITGGYVVRDRSLPSLYGRYVYGDFCDPALRSAKLSAAGAQDDRKIGLGVPSLSSFGEDARGRVYALSLGGAVYRLSPG